MTLPRGGVNMSFFNFNLKEEDVLQAQKEVLFKKWNKWVSVKDDDLLRERKIRTYFLEAVCTWSGKIEDHPAKEALDLYLHWLKSKGYKLGRKNGVCMAVSPRNTIATRESVNNNDWPECVGIINLIMAAIEK
jgi:hypothetical protein